MDKYTVDRFEGQFAILLLRKDETKQLDVPIDQLPSKTKEGDIVLVEKNDHNQIVSILRLEDETELARKKAEALLQKLINKNKR